jgi:hypothetical protein
MRRGILIIYFGNEQKRLGKEQNSCKKGKDIRPFFKIPKNPMENKQIVPLLVEISICCLMPTESRKKRII